MKPEKQEERLKNLRENRAARNGTSIWLADGDLRMLQEIIDSLGGISKAEGIRTAIRVYHAIMFGKGGR